MKAMLLSSSKTSSITNLNTESNVYMAPQQGIILPYRIQRERDQFFIDFHVWQVRRRNRKISGRKSSLSAGLTYHLSYMTVQHPGQSYNIITSYFLATYNVSVISFGLDRSKNCFSMSKLGRVV